MAEPLNVFISWSGRRSRALAEAMRDWLPQLFGDGVRPFLSSDIDKGRPWFEQISFALNGSHTALLCLTPENVASPWMHFEAGAIAKTLFSPNGEPVWQPARREPRIFTYLYEVGPGELPGAFGQYQATLANREDTRRLVESLARLSPSSAGAAVWLDRFDHLWPDLEDGIDDVGSLMPAEADPGLEARFRRKTFREALPDCTSQAWTERYAGAHETHSQLRAVEPVVEQRCRPFHVDLFRELAAQVDGYAMAMAALLVGREPFDLDDDGRLAVDAGIERACERRRERIEELVSQLLDPGGAPQCDESWRFANARTLEARRSLLHRKKHEMRGWTPRRRAKAAGNYTSQWELDRIMAYVVELERAPELAIPDDVDWPLPSAEVLLAAADGEVNRAHRANASRPPMALFYALVTLERALEREPADGDLAPRVQALAGRVEGMDEDLLQDRAEFRFDEVTRRLRQLAAPVTDGRPAPVGG